MRYLVVVEKGPTSFGAYVPDLPGCIAVGDTREEVLASIHEAIEFHVEGLREASRILCKRSSVILGWLLFHLNIESVGAVGTVGKRSLFFHGFHSPVSFRLR